MEMDKPFSVYGPMSVMFGDRPAANYLEIAKEMAASEGKSIDPVAARMLVEDSYVDDGLSGANCLDELRRVIGQKTIREDGSLQYSGTLAQVLGTVGLKVKVMVQSGETDEAVLEKIGGHVLGHNWNATDDRLYFKFGVNLSPRRRGVKVGPCLEKIDIEGLRNSVFTPHICLSVVNGCYDPAGLCAPFLAKYKVALRRATLLGLQWDDPLPEELQQQWRDLVTELVNLEKIEFPRSFRPADAEGKSWLICAWDGADEVFLGKVYIRWKVADSWVVRLVACKARVVPTKGLTTPRSELNGLLVMTRLADAVIEALPDKPERVICLGDSMCTISSFECRVALLAPYFANRVSEVQETMKRWSDMGVKVDPLYWVPGELNPADEGTRPVVKAEDIGPGSVHQQGPSWMTTNFDTWPIKRNIVKGLPKEEIKRKYCGQFNSVTVKNINRLCEIMHVSDSLLKVRGIYARFVRATIVRKRDSIVEPLTVEDYIKGDQLLNFVAMMDTNIMLNTMDLSGLAVFRQDCLVYTKGRLTAGMSSVLGVDKLLVLSPSCRLSWLIMVQCHQEDHRQDGGDALFRSRRHAWIVKGRRLADKVVKSCAWCKILSEQLKKNTEKQLMGDLPCERYMPNVKPFSNIAIDFLGVFVVKAIANYRTVIRCYPIVFCCLATGAIAIRVAAGYDTDSFLAQYNGYCAVRGKPTLVYTDRGSQLVKAAEYEDDNRRGVIGWEQVVKVSARYGTRWKFAPPGCQFRDGLAESRVKAIKATLRHLKVGSRLNYVTLQVLMERIANIVNERPVGVQLHGKGVGPLVPITPNLLLLGRSANQVPFDTQYDQSPDQYTKSMKLVEKVEDEWWKLWHHQVFDSLLPYHKWSTRERNLQVGDVCMIKYENGVRPGKADYRLCRVTEVLPDASGVVRTVIVKMRKRNLKEKGLPYNGPNLVSMRTSVQRLVVVCPVEQVPEEKLSEEVGEDEEQGGAVDQDGLVAVAHHVSKN